MLQWKQEKWVLKVTYTFPSTVGSEITGIAKICYWVATVDQSVGVQKTRYKAIKRLEA